MLKSSKPKKKSGGGNNLDASRRVMEGIEGDNKWLKLKQGENRVRILPSNREDESIVVPSILHYGFKIDGKNRAFPCMSSLKKPCPVCKLISHHDSDEDEDVKDLLRNIGPRKQFLFNVIDRKGDDSVKIMSVGLMIAREINNILNDTDYDDFTNPETGRDIKITKTGEGLTTRYSTRIAPKENEINVEGWEDNLFNLEKERYREIPTTKQYLKYIISAFGNVLDVEGALGVKAGEDEEEEESEEDEELDEDDDDEEGVGEEHRLVKPKKQEKHIKKGGKIAGEIPMKKKKKPKMEDL